MGYMEVHIEKPCNLGLTIPVLLYLNTEKTNRRRGLGPKLTFFKVLTFPTVVNQKQKIKMLYLALNRKQTEQNPFRLIAILPVEFCFDFCPRYFATCPGCTVQIR